ncbi:hypothetical protein [uncultured Helicobacter sp.]
MTNKQQIQKLRDNAELAMASYGYYDLIGKKIENDRKKYGDKADKPITLHDILDLTYKEYIAVESNPHKSDDEIKIGTLDGDFSPTQVKNFFDKYDLLDFYPKFDTKNNKQKEGFHACLFQDKESKELIRKLN